MIEHRKGSENVVADTLSRLVEEVQTLDDFIGFETTEFESEDYLELVKTVTQNKERLPDTKVENNLVFRRNNMSVSAELEEFEWKLWIPENLTSTLIEEAHVPENKSHGGIRKTLHYLRQKFYWPNMVAQVRNFIRNCLVCKECKSI